MDWLEKMNAAMDYIESHLADEILYEKAAHSANCSTYHFQRMFPFITNISLAEYIRCRRLTLAGIELQTTDIKVIDAALKYGYESPEAFSRAFKAFHKAAPVSARDKGVTLKVYPRMTFQNKTRVEEFMKNAGNGNVVSLEKTAAGFDCIVLYGIGDVKVHFADSHKVIVTTDSNIQDFIGIDVSNNTLHIEKQKNADYHPTELTIDVFLPEIKGVTLAGAGDIKIMEGSISNLKIDLTGSGDIDTEDCQVENVYITLAGSGDIKVRPTKVLNAILSGNGDIDAQEHPVENADVTLCGNGDIKLWASDTLKAVLSGNGDIDAQGHQVKYANATLTGNGTIRLWAADTLNAVLSGIGNILYKGNPNINKSVTGMGEIIQV